MKTTTPFKKNIAVMTKVHPIFLPRAERDTCFPERKRKIAESKMRAALYSACVRNRDVYMFNARQVSRYEVQALCRLSVALIRRISP
jgi:hypothetical protein